MNENNNKNRQEESSTNNTSKKDKPLSHEENNENKDLIGNTLFGKYLIKKKIGSGSQSMIFSGQNIKTKEEVAIKVESQNNNNCLLKEEIKMLIRLKNHKGIVNIITCGKRGHNLILIEKLLGKSLDKLFLDSSKKFTLSDICQIAIQGLDRIEFIHSKGIIHCDIKPDNFSIGLKDPNVIYLIDFGLCQDYKNIKTGKHREFSFTGYMTGTARYASRNALRGKQLSRRDDIESFMYMILYFLSKRLPWQGMKAKNLSERYKKIYNYKKNFNYKDFCSNFPKEIIAFVEYIRNLAYKEKPNYEYMRKLFTKILLDKNKFISDYFSWMANMKDIEIERKRPNSESKTKIQEQEKKIHSSILKISTIGNAGSIKESTIAVTNLKLSKISPIDSIVNLGESQVTVYKNENKKEDDKDEFDNDIINNIKEVEEVPIEDKEESNNDNQNNLFSTEAKIKDELEKFQDDEEEKKFEIKLNKELEVITEVDEDDDEDIKNISDKRGGSVHYYINDINEYDFKKHKENISSNIKKDKNINNIKEIESDNKENMKIQNNNEDEKNNISESEKKINEINIKNINENENIDDIKLNEGDKKDREIKNNQTPQNLIQNKDNTKEEKIKEKEVYKKKIKDEKQSIVKRDENKNLKEMQIEQKKEIRSYSFTNRMTNMNKLEEINSQIINNIEKNEIHKKTNYTDDKIRYSSIGSKNYEFMKKGKAKNKNCIIF